jgi:penicillin-binding protein 1A
MYKLGMINKEQASQARRSRIEITPKARQTFSNIIAPYFYSYVFQELNDLLGVEVAKEGDFIVETRLNQDKQKKAETALQNYIKSYGSQYRFSEGAIVTLDTKTGEILALVGGKDYNKSQFNRATQAKRQPGSTFKAFAYAAALQKGISPYKTYSCAPLRWQAMNYKPCERSGGNINMFQGIAQSENAIALRVAKDVGLDAVIDMAYNLGVKSELKKVPGLILGQSETTVLEMTGAYAAFDNKGVWNRPHGIKTIRDGRDCEDYKNYNTCRVVYAFNQDNNETKKVISPKVAQTMTKMMQGVTTSGTGRSASIGKGEAGKTGTTNNGVDLWFIGYIPSKHLVTGIWLGNDDNSPTKSTSTQAASLWGKYMLSIVNRE